MRVLSRTNRGQNYLLWRARDNDKHICYNSFAILLYTSKKKCQKEKTTKTEKKHRKFHLSQRLAVRALQVGYCHH